MSHRMLSIFPCHCLAPVDHPNPYSPSATCLRVLLHDIVFRATLLRFANIMLILGLDLGLSITSHAGNSTADSPGDAVGDARAVVVELACSLLAFAFGILLLTGALE